LDNENIIKDNFDQLLTRIINNSEEDEVAMTDSLINEFTKLLNDSDIRSIQPNITNIIKTKKGQIHGFGYSEELNSLDLYEGILLQEDSKLNIDKFRIDQKLNKVEKLIMEMSSEDYSETFDESDVESRRLSKILFNSNLSKIDIVFFTNGTTPQSNKNLESLFLGQIKVNVTIYDLNNWIQYIEEEEDIIDIDFEEDYSQKIQAIKIPDISPDISGYLALIPASILIDLYDKYQRQIMQYNVRAFLNFTGPINKGIRDTVVNNPEKFVAFNNGITAVATNIILDSENKYIISASDFKIVNGGQTTATLYFTSRNKNTANSNFSDIVIPMKILDIDKKNLDEFNENIDKISRYSNNQNKVQAADFDANDPFHIELNKFSMKQFIGKSKWFYESKRKDYQSILYGKDTNASKIQFQKEYPKGAWKKSIHGGTKDEYIDQYIDKVDAAKVMLCFWEYPVIAAQGRNSAFTEFQRIKNEKNLLATGTLFKELVAKMIIYKRLVQIHKNNYGATFRSEGNPRATYANIHVLYTLAFISYLAGKKKDKSLNYDLIIEHNNFTRDINFYQHIEKKTRHSGYIPDLLDFVITVLESIGVIYPEQAKKNNQVWQKLIESDLPENLINFPDNLLTDNKKQDLSVEKINTDRERIESQIQVIKSKGKVWWENLFEKSKRSNGEVPNRLIRLISLIIKNFDSIEDFINKNPQYGEIAFKLVEGQD
tara:strand:- start:4532 stop:6673 length:2142 start_codon:yes stop_codon:yes gene_type:complete